MQLAGLGAFEHDIANGWLILSDRASEICGTSRAVLWADWIGGVAEEDRPAVLALERRILTDPRPADREVALRYHRSDGAERFIVMRFRVLGDAGERPLRVIGVIADETAHRAAVLRAAWLSAELQHRVKNVMAMVRSLARRTLETSEDLSSYFSHFDGRLNALSRVQSTLVRRMDEGLDLEELVREELLQHAAESGQARVSGPAVRLQGVAAEYIALALHELAVNAVKFGALAGRGRIDVSWSVTSGPSGDHLHLAWWESGVPLVETQSRRLGFGRRLIEKGLAYQLGAETSFRLMPGGVRCQLDVQLPA